MHRILFALAHPDDESMGCGTTIVRHTAAGVEVHLLTATRGGAGWNGLPAGRRPEELVEIRGHELARVAEVLGLASVELWDYPDGSLAGCNQAEVTDRVAAVVERLQPDLVVTWGPDGAYGHPDHIAIGACADAACERAAAGRPRYHLAIDRTGAAAWDAAAAAGGGDPLPIAAQDAVSVVFAPTPGEVERKAQAIRCHTSQLAGWWPAVLDHPAVFAPLGRECYLRVGGDAAGTVLASGVFPELE
jgi:LmbE family N-acetylglucosaminyl deacetylase